MVWSRALTIRSCRRSQIITTISFSAASRFASRNGTFCRITEDTRSSSNSGRCIYKRKRMRRSCQTSLRTLHLPISELGESVRSADQQSAINNQKSSIYNVLSSQQHTHSPTFIIARHYIQLSIAVQVSHIKSINASSSL